MDETKCIEFPILSFFTGAGFLDLGFLQDGFELVWHNENHKPFIQAFEFAMMNLGYSGASAVIQNRNSIIDIGPNEIIGQAFPKGKPPSNFGIIGGPPCPDFSVGGHNLGEAGNRGKLSEVFVNRIIELNPAFLLFENVPGILRTKKHRKFLALLLHKLSSHYFLDMKILNALDFGVPQDRERVFIVGFRRTWLRRKVSSNELKRIDRASSFLSTISDMRASKFLAEMDHWFSWPEDPEFKDAKNRFPWPEGSLPKGVVPQKPDVPPELMVSTYICDESRYGLPNSEECLRPRSGKFATIEEGDVSRKSFKRLHRYRYSPTAAYGHNEVHLHPTLPRRLSVREAMMIQSVPNTYIFPSNLPLTAKYKTIGNGVPVKMARSMAGAISNFIKGVYR